MYCYTIFLLHIFTLKIISSTYKMCGRIFFIENFKEFVYLEPLVRKKFDIRDIESYVCVYVFAQRIYFTNIKVEKKKLI